MKREPVSVVVVAQAGNEGAALAAQAVAGLRPSLGARDEILVVADGSSVTDGLSRTATIGQRRMAGLRRARHEIVVLVVADAVAPAHALDPLVVEVSAGAKAAAPAHDLGAGRQQVCPPLAAVGTAAGLRAWTRDRREQRKGRRSTVTALGDAVVAARRDALLDDGCEPGFATRLGGYGPLVVVEDSTWHLLAGAALHLMPSRPGPAVSGVLIVKDEAEVLAECLAAVTRWVDELVVYDTGSTDDTLAIARAAGATVIEGYWDDDFGAARNRALAHCRGEWILWVDADEVAVGEREHLLRAMGTPGVMALDVTIENLTEAGTGTPSVLPIRRAARREHAWFVGRVHEQLMHRSGSGLSTELAQGIRLVHSGYTAARVLAKDKRNRNLDLARRAVEDGDSGLSEGEAYVALARSQAQALAFADALETADRAWTLHLSPMGRRDIAGVGVLSAARLLREGPGREWLARLRAASTVQARADGLEALLCAALGDWERAAALLASLPERVEDDDRRSVERAGSVELEVEVLLRLGRDDEAADRIVAVAAGGAVNLSLGSVVDLLRRTGRLTAYARSLPAESLLATCAETRSLDPVAGDDMLQALWDSERHRVAVLAAAAEVATQLPVLRALEWAVRLRGAGSAAECPLVSLAQDCARSPRDRVVAAAVALEMFADERVVPAFIAAADLVPDELASHVATELRMLAPAASARWLA